MHLRRIRLVPAVLIAWLLITRPAVMIHAQDAPLPPDVAETMQRLMSTLDAVDDYDRLLKNVETMSAQTTCTPNAETQSLGEALDWSIDAQFQADRDLVRGRSALDACRLGIADDALEGLTQQSEQVTQMTKVFSAIPLNGATPSETLDRLIEQTHWIAVLKSDAADLGDLARRLAEIGGSDAALSTRAAQARRLVEISNRAEEAVGKTLTCALAPQPLAGVRRIMTMIEPIPGVAKELELAFKAAQQTCPSAAPVLAAAPKPTGPSWLPAAAGETPKAAPATIPSWVPTKDAPTMVASTTRPADMLGEVRARLIADEAQRIEEQSRRYADARTQRAGEAVQASALPVPTGMPGMPPPIAMTPASTTASAARPGEAGAASGMMNAVLTTPLAHDQALAIAQRQVQAQQEQRASRGKSFLGVLNRVTAAVGAVAKTTGLGPSGLDALLPKINTVTSAASTIAEGGGVNAGMNAALGAASSLGAPMPNAANGALSAMRLLTAPAGANPMSPAPGVAAPGSSAAPGAIPQGGSVGYLPPTPNDPFLGRWTCTSSESATAQIQMNMQETREGLVMTTEGGTMPGNVANGRATFNQAVPTQNGMCQLTVTLQQQAGGLVGGTSVACANAQPSQGTLQCRR